MVNISQCIVLPHSSSHVYRPRAHNDVFFNTQQQHPTPTPQLGNTVKNAFQFSVLNVWVSLLGLSALQLATVCFYSTQGVLEVLNQLLF